MSSEERADVVDENDVVVGVATRAEIRANNLRHRGVWVIVRDGNGLVLVHRRTDNKDIYPGLWDAVVGGLVLAGESYEDAARREVEEEIGVAGFPLRFIEKRVGSSPMNVVACVFTAVVDVALSLDREEIAEGLFVHPSDLEEFARAHQFIDGVIEQVCGYL